MECNERVFDRKMFGERIFLDAYGKIEQNEKNA